MFDDAGIWSTVLQVSGVALVAYAAILWLASVIWVAGDVQKRTDSAVVQVAAIAFAAVFFLPGLILYVALRPGETMEERAERRMEMQALAAQAATSSTCGNCYRMQRDEFVRCPYCAYQLRTLCTRCDRPNEASWVVCPFCGNEPVAAAGRSAGVAQVAPTLVTVASAPRRNGHAPVR